MLRKNLGFNVISDISIIPRQMRLCEQLTVHSMAFPVTSTLRRKFLLTGYVLVELN